MPQHDPDPLTLPILEESLAIGRRRVATGHVRVSTITESVDEIVEIATASTEVDVVHVPVSREVDTMPEVRVESGTVIVPVVEEVAVVVRRLVLREEIHIKRRRTDSLQSLPVQLLKQRAVVLREGRKPDQERNVPMDDSGFGGRTLTAFFDTRADAEAAMVRLSTLGIGDVRITGGDEFAGREDMGRDRGFWESISDFFFPAEDRATYAEGLRRGGFLVTASNVPVERHDEAVEILDDEGSINLDERAETWRAEGWAAPGAIGASSMGPDGAALDAMGTVPVADEETRHAYAVDAPMSETMPRGDMRDPDVMRDRSVDEDVIPVVRESLRVGKRDVALGRVRVRSYLVEEPVSEDVTLHEERVEIERRPVDRVLEGDAAVFTDRTIEAEEHAEEAVVSKEARVVEEIALRRHAEDRTETVSDTVRRTEVEIEDDREKMERAALDR